MILSHNNYHFKENHLSSVFTYVQGHFLSNGNKIDRLWYWNEYREFAIEIYDVLYKFYSKYINLDNLGVIESYSMREVERIRSKIM